MKKHQNSEKDELREKKEEKSAEPAKGSSNAQRDKDNMTAEATTASAEETAKKEVDEELSKDTKDATANAKEAEDDVAAKLAECQDKYLRLAAEFDNFRKRTRKEKADLIEMAGEDLIKDLLPVVDDFERGLNSIDQSNDLDAVKAGITLIYNKIQDFLTSKGVTEVKALNETFEADRHEAVTKIPAPTDDMKGKVVDVIQKGYTLRDKIIRYPKVVVGE